MCEAGQDRADTAMSHPDSPTWWKHRRRHSYTSLFGLFALPGLSVVLDVDRLSATLPLLQTMAWIFCAIIITYVLAATGEDVSKILGARK